MAQLSPPLEVHDVFAGAGGFSCGTSLAGCRVASATDINKLALCTHAWNHPDAAHVQLKLPAPRTALPLPTDGRRFHAHFSPPCQLFSGANKLNRREGDTKTGEELVNWSLDTAVTCGAATWSFEQVPSPRVVALIEAARKRHPGRIAYTKVDVSRLGVPQERKRLLAGPPAMIQRLRERHAASRTVTATRDAIAKPRGTHVRNGIYWTTKRRIHRTDDPGPGHSKFKYTKAEWTDFCRPLDRPAYTVLAAHPLSWVTQDANGGFVSHARMSVEEQSLLQTFPTSYRWPLNKLRAYRQIGNAVPPALARCVMEAAVETLACA